MSLTAEQQANFDEQRAMEEIRHGNQIELRQREAKLELVRIAKDILLENARAKPVAEREVSVADITEYAASLSLYVEG